MLFGRNLNACNLQLTFDFPSLVQLEEDFNSRTEKWFGGVGVGGYLRPDKFLDHLTVIIKVL